MNANIVRLLLFLVAMALAYFSWKGMPGSIGKEGAGPVVPAAGEPRLRPALSQATLSPTYAVDLETGHLKDAEAGTLDLWWEAKTETERCLCPYIQSKALLARIPPGDFDSMDAAKLAALDNSADGFVDTDADPGVQPGMTFAVRTVEGNFARVRIVDIDRSKRLTLEWQLYPPAAATQAAPPRTNASLEIPQLLEQARQALRARNKAGAIALTEQAAALADGMPKGSRRRIDLLQEIGSLYWSASNLSTDSTDVLALAETVLLSAVNEMHGPAGSTSELGPLRREIPAETAGKTYRMLGVIYRDRGLQSRDASIMAKAVPWFERALVIAEGLPKDNAQQASFRSFKLVSELNEVADAQCQSGETATALANEDRIKKICVETNGAGSAGVCLDQYRGCKPWLPQIRRAPDSVGTPRPAPEKENPAARGFPGE